MYSGDYHWFGYFFTRLAATLISTTALPYLIIPTFLFVVVGLGLNAISLLSLSLVGGVLVDDAIVEVENIEASQIL